MENTVIDEVSEAEENNTTQLKLGSLLLSESKSDNLVPKPSQQADNVKKSFVGSSSG